MTDIHSLDPAPNALTITIDTFRPCLNDTFRLTARGDVLDLVLSEVEDLGDSANRRAFSLMFAGPPQPAKPQGTYRLDHPAIGTLDVFLVPLGPWQGAFRYQAVFA